MRVELCGKALIFRARTSAAKVVGCGGRSSSKASNGNAVPSSHCKAHAACACFAKAYRPSPCSIDTV